MANAVASSSGPAPSRPSSQRFPSELSSYRQPSFSASGSSRTDPLLLRCRAVLNSGIQSGSKGKGKGKERAIEDAGLTLDALDELVALFKAGKAQEQDAAAAAAEDAATGANGFAGDDAQDATRDKTKDPGLVSIEEEEQIDVQALRKGVERTLLEAHRATSRAYLDNLEDLVQVRSELYDCRGYSLSTDHATLLLHASPSTH